MKNAFLFHLKSLFRYGIGIFGFRVQPLSCALVRRLLVIQKKRLDYKDKVSLKIHDIATWLTNICNTCIAKCLMTTARQLNIVS